MSGSGSASVGTVDFAPDDPEGEQRLREEYVAQLQSEVAAIEAKMSGWREALAAKKDELKQARAAARKGA